MMILKASTVHAGERSRAGNAVGADHRAGPCAAAQGIGVAGTGRYALVTSRTLAAGHRSVPARTGHFPHGQAVTVLAARARGASARVAALEADHLVHPSGAPIHAIEPSAAHIHHWIAGRALAGGEVDALPAGDITEGLGQALIEVEALDTDITDGVATGWTLITSRPGVCVGVGVGVRVRIGVGVSVDVSVGVGVGVGIHVGVGVEVRVRVGRWDVSVVLWCERGSTDAGYAALPAGAVAVRGAGCEAPSAEAELAGFAAGGLLIRDALGLLDRGLIPSIVAGQAKPKEDRKEWENQRLQQ